MDARTWPLPWCDTDADALRDDLLAQLDPVEVSRLTVRLGAPQSRSTLFVGNGIDPRLSRFFGTALSSACDTALVDRMVYLIADISDLTGVRLPPDIHALDRSVEVTGARRGGPPGFPFELTASDVVCDLLLTPLKSCGEHVASLASMWLHLLDIPDVVGSVQYRSNRVCWFDARLEVLIAAELGFTPARFEQNAIVVNIP